jgi:membrane-associated phospholipid phosphatase
MTARVALSRALDTRAPWTLPRARGLLRRITALRVTRVIGWWLAFVFAWNIVWSRARGSADDLGFPVHGAGLERSLFGGLPGASLQDWVHSLSPSLVEWSCVVVYTSWFIVPVLAALIVSLKAPHRIGSFFMWWIAVFYVSLPAFIFLPVAPPWMSDPHVQRLATLAVGQIEDNNQFAALPSMHVALPAVLGFWFLRERWNGLAAAMFAYTALIGFEVVVSGEHYIIDVIGGLGVAAAVYGAMQIDWRRMLSRLGTATMRLRTSESGQAVIEFAFMAPIILALLLLIFDGGLAVDRRMGLQHAIREGGRYASLGRTAAEVKQRTVDESEGLLDLSHVSVCYVSSSAAGNPIRVKATYNYNFVASGDELLGVFGVDAPTIPMNPSIEYGLEAPAGTGINAC